MRAPNRFGCVCDHDVCLKHSMPLINGFGCEHQTRKRDPVEGDVYVKDDDHRRVISVIDGRVCYSSGTDINHWCNLDTFRSWFTKSKMVNDGKKVAA